ncbi:hypothetical protein E2C01_081972 [Portunus trituberculatus]|uniref:Uncharacterized protein n=1 Tax=Portunus trituberculatus TaxID=210409 RepID=A0A5B7INR6_PORTR|nr:hypothetical protein [Portunus trituberculatus]
MNLGRWAEAEGWGKGESELRQVLRRQLFPANYDPDLLQTLNTRAIFLKAEVNVGSRGSRWMCCKARSCSSRGYKLARVTELRRRLLTSQSLESPASASR